jgi:hypothetical protein
MEFTNQQRLIYDSAPGPGGFEYQKLETSTSIRILELEPGTSDEPLRGRLQHFDLKSEIPSFDALSYVWGVAVYDQTFECHMPIRIDTVMITKSLEEALQRLRSPQEIKHIWADGICINQHDISERENQVKLMGQLYTRAKQVKIWLGPDSDHAAKKSFDLLKRYGLSVASKYSFDSTTLRDPAIDWSPLSELSKLEYFNRIWV